jgi:hypothetical protein
MRRAAQLALIPALAAGALLATSGPAARPAGALGGTLSVTATAAALGVLTAGADHPGLPLGTITITDTLADPTPTAWVAQVAASNCTVPRTGALATLSPAQAVIASTALAFTPGAVTVVTAAGGGNEVTPVAGPSASFGAVGGGGFSSPITVSTGPPGAVTLDNNGVFTQTPTLDVNLSGLTVPPGTFTCTLQYTITG